VSNRVKRKVLVKVNPKKVRRNSLKYNNYTFG
jgi:hypothetical protein